MKFMYVINYGYKYMKIKKPNSNFLSYSIFLKVKTKTIIHPCL